MTWVLNDSSKALLKLVVASLVVRMHKMLDSMPAVHWVISLSKTQDLTSELLQNLVHE